MRLALDEQIFAIQAFGGISRMHAEVARQFVTSPELQIDVLPMSAPIINRYVLDDPALSASLGVKQAKMSGPLLVGISRESGSTPRLTSFTTLSTYLMGSHLHVARNELSVFMT